MKTECWRELYKSMEPVKGAEIDAVGEDMICPVCGEKFRLLYSGRAYGEDRRPIGSAERFECLCGETVKRRICERR